MADNKSYIRRKSLLRFKQNNKTDNVNNNTENSNILLKTSLNNNEKKDIFDKEDIFNRESSIELIYDDNAIKYNGKEYINSNQVKYISANNDSCDSAISASLWQSTMKLLSDLKNDVGNISLFLQKKMNWSHEELSEYLSPEQQDVLALMINKFDKGENPYNRSILLGDTTGFGKGRPLMAYSAYCKKNGVFPIIFTLQENLFSNLWADVLDMNLQDVFNRPFPVNAGSSIEDTRSSDSKKLFKKIKPSELKEIVNSGELPKEFGMIMLSYSQLNVADSIRQKFFEKFISNNKTAIILDESQAIVEMSANTSLNVSKLLNLSYVSINSSATSARHIDNMSSYIHIYPWLKDMTNYELSTISSDKRLWLSSLSVNKAIADGKMLRREHDMSGLELEMHLPNNDAIEKYNSISDEFSYVCGKIIEFHSIIEQRVDELNSPIEKNNGYTKGDSAVTFPEYEYKALPIFQRLHPLSRQLLACMMSEQIARRAINSLENGEKPFIVMDMTMEAALSKIMNNNDRNKNDGEEDLLNEDESDLASKPLTLKDLMRVALDKCSEVLYKKRGEKGKSEIMVIDESHIDGYNNAYNNIIKLINNMQDLPASPMDYIRDIIEAEGQKRFNNGEIKKAWTICEISGRSRKVVDNKYIPVIDIGKNALISGYNSGIYDGIIASRKASTGLSAHSSIKFLDQRPRRMIEGIGCDNPIERKQMFGRIDRRGQVCKPKYETTNIGTPYNLIKIASDNAKSIELSASVSASKNNGLLTNIPDLLSPVANEIAREILSKDFQLSKKLGITISEDNNDYCAPLFRRCFVLSSVEQNNLLSKFKELYKEKIKDYEDDNNDNLGGNWYPVNQKALEIIDNDISNSVILTKLERVVDRVSFSSKNIPTPNPIQDNVQNCILFINNDNNKYEYLLKFKDPWIKSVKQALFVYNNHMMTSFSRNRVGIENEKIDYGVHFLKNATRGTSVYLKDKYGRLSPAIIASVSVPTTKEEYFDWHKYSFNYVIPGEKKIYRIGLDTIMNSNGRFRIEKNRDVILKEFDNKSSGIGKEELYILDGNNPLSLVLLSNRAKAGKLIKWTDNMGIDKNSIMIAEDELSLVINSNKRIWNRGLIDKLLSDSKILLCGVNGNLVKIKASSDGLIINVPSKAKDKKSFSSLIKLCANITNMNENSNEFKIPKQYVKEFIDKVYNEYPFNYKNITNDYILNKFNNKKQVSFEP